MNLRYLLLPWIQKYIPNINIYGLSMDSRTVKKGYLFFSILGIYNDGRNFIQEAIRNGAHCVLIESNYINNHSSIIYINNICLIYFYNLKKYISSISGNYYNNPSKKINFIGVTGTNGKTTVSYLISSWIELLGNKSSLISTIGNGRINKLRKTLNTTDSALDMQKEIYNSYKLNINNVISEISSQGINQFRVKSLFFKLAILTNINHDHLDYHKNFENYKNSKLSLFTKHNIKSSIINFDDYNCKKYYYIFNKSNKISIKNNFFYKDNYINIYKIFFLKNKTYIFFKFNNLINKIILNFIGYFNVTNIFLSLITLLELNYPLKEIIKTSKYLKLPIGRMKIIYINNKIVIIDYAHTPYAFSQVFKNICKIYKNKKIYSVFGSGGDRDKKKRKIIGKISDKYSYKIILTNDNPRNENEMIIINDICNGILNKNKIKIILDRKEAIEYAIKKSCINSIIIIIGKGHENYQIIKNKKYFFSDFEIINNFKYKND